MPLLEGDKPASTPGGAGQTPSRRQSEQYSDLARAAIMSSASSTNSSPSSELELPSHEHEHPLRVSSLMPPPKSSLGRTANTTNPHPTASMKPFHPLPLQPFGGVGTALTDTPAPTAPNSPQM